MKLNFTFDLYALYLCVINNFSIGLADVIILKYVMFLNYECDVCYVKHVFVIHSVKLCHTCIFVCNDVYAMKIVCIFTSV